jgi:two-component system phosphate regulon response regulator PhoB
MGGAVLVVDDEPDIRNLVVFNLRSAGFGVSSVATGEEAIAEASARAPSVVVLDVMLPDLSGTEVCRRLRAVPACADVAVMMLTARDDESTRVVGFDAGADDYVVKPFDVSEVVARVRALARCAEERRAARRVLERGDRLRCGALEIDRAAQRAFVGGAEIDLRPIDFKLLLLLLENPNRIFTRSQILRVLFGANDLAASARTIDTQVKRVRKELGAHEGMLETVNGLGYRLRAA